MPTPQATAVLYPLTHPQVHTGQRHIASISDSKTIDDLVAQVHPPIEVYSRHSKVADFSRSIAGTRVSGVSSCPCTYIHTRRRYAAGGHCWPDARHRCQSRSGVVGCPVRRGPGPGCTPQATAGSIRRKARRASSRSTLVSVTLPVSVMVKP